MCGHIHPFFVACKLSSQFVVARLLISLWTGTRCSRSYKRETMLSWWSTCLGSIRELKTYSYVTVRGRSQSAHILLHLCHYIQFKLFYPDGGRRLRDVAALSGEPYLPLTEWSTNQGFDYSDMHEFWAVRFHPSLVYIII